MNEEGFFLLDWKSVYTQTPPDEFPLTLIGNYET